MDTKTLVTDDATIGQEILAKLDEGGVDVSAAFWLCYSDTEVWKFWIATPEAAKNLQEAYIRVAEILSAGAAKLSDFDLSRINLVSPDDPFIRSLGAMISVGGTSPVRFSRNVINGVYIEDALIYRLRQAERKRA